MNDAQKAILAALGLLTTSPSSAGATEAEDGNFEANQSAYVQNIGSLSLQAYLEHYGVDASFLNKENIEAHPFLARLADMNILVREIDRTQKDQARTGSAVSDIFGGAVAYKDDERCEIELHFTTPFMANEFMKNNADYLLWAVGHELGHCLDSKYFLGGPGFSLAAEPWAEYFAAQFMSLAKQDDYWIKAVLAKNALNGWDAPHTSLHKLIPVGLWFVHNGLEMPDEEKMLSIQSELALRLKAYDPSLRKANDPWAFSKTAENYLRDLPAMRAEYEDLSHQNSSSGFFGLGQASEKTEEEREKRLSELKILLPEHEETIFIYEYFAQAETLAKDTGISQIRYDADKAAMPRLD